MDALVKINVRGKELEFHREIPAYSCINDKLPGSGWTWHVLLYLHWEENKKMVLELSFIIMSLPVGIIYKSNLII